MLEMSFLLFGFSFLLAEGGLAPLAGLIGGAPIRTESSKSKDVDWITVLSLLVS